LQRDVRALRPGDVIIVKLVATDVKRDSADSEVGSLPSSRVNCRPSACSMRCIRSASSGGALTKINVCRDMASRFASIDVVVISDDQHGI
jgi:hypothetical protein